MILFLLLTREIPMIFFFLLKTSIVLKKSPYGRSRLYEVKASFFGSKSMFRPAFLGDNVFYVTSYVAWKPTNYALYYLWYNVMPTILLVFFPIDVLSLNLLPFFVIYPYYIFLYWCEIEGPFFLTTYFFFYMGSINFGFNILGSIMVLS